jgi:hypothetical protein
MPESCLLDSPLHIHIGRVGIFDFGRGPRCIHRFQGDLFQRPNRPGSSRSLQSRRISPGLPTGRRRLSDRSRITAEFLEISPGVCKPSFDIVHGGSICSSSVECVLSPMDDPLASGTTDCCLVGFGSRVLPKARGRSISYLRALGQLRIRITDGQRDADCN